MTKEIHDVGSVAKPHPIMKKLEAAAGDESIVPLDGFLGESDKTTFRLYKRLDPDDCYVIPKDIVIETAQIPGDEQGRIRLFLKASGRIMRIRRSSLTVERLQEAARVAERAGVWEIPWWRDLRVGEVWEPIMPMLCWQARRDLDRIDEQLSNPNLSNEDRKRLENARFRAEIDVANYCRG
jgi:hypothetical protein